MDDIDCLPVVCWVGRCPEIPKPLHVPLLNFQEKISVEVSETIQKNAAFNPTSGCAQGVGCGGLGGVVMAFAMELADWELKCWPARQVYFTCPPDYHMSSSALACQASLFPRLWIGLAIATTVHQLHLQQEVLLDRYHMSCIVGSGD